MNVRPALPADVDHLARIWHEGWHQAHAHLVPAALTRTRTLESFHERLTAALPDVRVASAAAEPPAGFSVIKHDELYQLYVASHARGSGIAAVLIADAEAQLTARGVKVAWLGCAIGNERAARFYEKCGWRRVGTIVYPSATSEGVFPLEVWRYEKELYSL